MNKWVVLREDVDAMLIPNGMPFIIPAGTNVEITQALGGSVTVHLNGQLARIEGQDAKALGIDVAVEHVEVDEDKIATGPVSREEIYAKLSEVYDPEIPVNIVELGLVYNVVIQENLSNNKNHVIVEMTLTAPGCGMGPVLVTDVEKAAVSHPNVTSCKVELVFDPIWNQDMISEAAKLDLGIL